MSVITALTSFRGCFKQLSCHHNRITTRWPTLYQMNHLTPKSSRGHSLSRKEDNCSWLRIRSSKADDVITMTFPDVSQQLLCHCKQTSWSLCNSLVAERWLSLSNGTWRCLHKPFVAAGYETARRLVYVHFECL